MARRRRNRYRPLTPGQRAYAQSPFYTGPDRFDIGTGIGGSGRTSGGAGGGTGGFQIPLRPPPGTYDPALDAQERAANRGYGDLQADTIRLGGRAATDYELGKGDIVRNWQEGVEDLGRYGERARVGYGEQRSDIERGRDRGLADLLMARTRGEEDYGLATTELGRQFRVLGNNQGQAARAAGVAQGGALAQAMGKRRVNQAREQGGLDLANRRFMEENDLSRNRLTEDSETSLGRLGAREGWLGEDEATGWERLSGAATRGLGALGLGFERGEEDRTTALERAGRENVQFGRDIGAQRWYESKGLYTPPAGVEVGLDGRPLRKRRSTRTSRYARSPGISSAFNTVGSYWR